MKLIKNSNRKKLLISRKEWMDIGEKQKWINNFAQVSTPTETPVKTPTKTPTKTPSNPTPTTPFKPPRPKVTPKPKAKRNE